MNSKAEHSNTTIKSLITTIDFIDSQIKEKMSYILARPSIPTVNGFQEEHRLDNLYMSHYMFKNNILSIYECFEHCLNSFDLTEIADLDHTTTIKIKHRRLTIADTVRSLIENMVQLPEFGKSPKDEKFVKSQYVVYIDFVEKMHNIDVAINTYFDKNLTNVQGLSDFPNFVKLYTDDILKGTHSTNFMKFGQILIKSTFDASKFHPIKQY